MPINSELRRVIRARHIAHRDTLARIGCYGIIALALAVSAIALAIGIRGIV